ncbi:hypothetical protein C2E23DRAFT_843874 [Lenzites betulinus]|nr:hypothetical protein C2E23DRAFT_843874 [Lenzites betulinus]
MSDARSLLRAKRQEARVDHPLATYNAAGVLRCVACGTSVKHAAAWEGHIGSKTHRTNAARLRAELAREEQRVAAEQQLGLKRKSMELDEDEDDENAGEGEGPARKAARVESAQEDLHAEEQSRPGAARSALPADFFSDPSQAPPPPEEDEEEDAAARPDTNGAPDALEQEWARFQESVVNAPDKQETYERATIMAEPVVALEVPQGFPGAPEEAEAEEVLDEEGVRRRKAQEERELIMDRLVEEEQAQEEADARVSQLKTKLEALKRKREAARAAKLGAKAA